MAHELILWKELTKLTQGEPFEIERIRLKKTGIAIEGRFELPPSTQLTEEDQVFISAFLRSHGSIKEMERLFGVSYPTIKARLGRIAERLPFVETIQNPEEEALSESLSRKQVLAQLEAGKINATEAARLLRNQGGDRR